MLSGALQSNEIINSYFCVMSWYSTHDSKEVLPKVANCYLYFKNKMEGEKMRGMEEMMGKTKYLIKIIFFSLIVLTFVGVNLDSVLAQDGAEVPTKGEITLFDEKPASSDEQSSSSSSNLESKELGTENTVAKPKGKLPSTGELVNYGLISSGVLVFIASLFYLVKRRKDHDETSEGGHE